VRITSARNQTIQSTRKLSKRAVRDRERLFTIEGEIAVTEAVEAGVRLHELFVSESAEDRHAGLSARVASQGGHRHEVSEQVMKALSGTMTPPGILAVASFVDVEASTLLEKNLALPIVLADVRDPGNAGTILRTGWAVGADAAFLSRSTVDLYNSKVVRASAGALFNLPVSREVEVPFLIENLQRKGLMTVAAHPEGRVSYDEVDMSGPCALIFGNEAWGVSDDILEQVDVSAKIPMEAGAESLNVGVAAAVFMIEAARQRRRKP
jgi:TrmH family RNA methyltransferase